MIRKQNQSSGAAAKRVATASEAEFCPFRLSIDQSAAPIPAIKALNPTRSGPTAAANAHPLQPSRRDDFHTTATRRTSGSADTALKIRWARTASLLTSEKAMTRTLPAVSPGVIWNDIRYLSSTTFRLSRAFPASNRRK